MEQKISKIPTETSRLSITKNNNPLYSNLTDEQVLRLEYNENENYKNGLDFETFKTRMTASMSLQEQNKLALRFLDIKNSLTEQDIQQQLNRNNYNKIKESFEQSNFLQNAITGLKDSITFDNIPFAGKVKQNIKFKQLDDINYKAYKGEQLSEEEQKMFKDEIKELQKQQIYNNSNSYKIASSIVPNVSYMIEFALRAKILASSVLLDKIANPVVKSLSSSALTAFEPTRLFNQYYARQLAGDLVITDKGEVFFDDIEHKGVFKTLCLSYLDSLVSDFAEDSSDIFIKPWAEKYSKTLTGTKRKVFDLLFSTTEKTDINIFGNAFNGFANENFEEWFEKPLRQIFGLEENEYSAENIINSFGLGSKDELFVQMGVISILGGISSTSNKLRNKLLQNNIEEQDVKSFLNTRSILQQEQDLRTLQNIENEHNKTKYNNYLDKKQQEVIDSGRTEQEAKNERILLDEFFTKYAIEQGLSRLDIAEQYELEIQNENQAEQDVDNDSIETFYQKNPEIEKNINDVLNSYKQGKNDKQFIGKITDWQLETFKQNGLNVNENTEHRISTNFLKHKEKKHGIETETNNTQTPVLDSDIKNIPYVINDPDYIILGKKTNSGNQGITYIKNISKGITYYVEAVLDKDNVLESKTIYRKKMGINTTRKSGNYRNILNALDVNVRGDPSIVILTKENLKVNNKNTQDDSIETFYQKNPEIYTNINNILEKSKQNGTFSEKCKIGEISNWLVEEANKNNLNIDKEYIHDIDVSSIKHIKNKHGNESSESLRGQTAITDNDIKNIPYIVNNPDYVIFGTKNKLNKDGIIYVKTLNDGTTYYIEEVRTNKKTLSADTMWKAKNVSPTPQSLTAYVNNHLRDTQTNNIKIIQNPNLKVNSLNQKTQNILGKIELGKESAIITLMESSNKSTLLHETGHYFLRFTQVLANSGSKLAQTELEEVKKFLGNPERENGNFSDEQNEKFARSFEQYLRRGVAPNSRLKQVFNDFKEWLRSIYNKAIELDANLTPEIINFFDKYISSDLDTDIEFKTNKLQEEIDYEKKTLYQQGLSNEEINDIINNKYSERLKEIEEQIKNGKGINNNEIEQYKTSLQKFSNNTFVRGLQKFNKGVFNTINSNLFSMNQNIRELSEKVYQEYLKNEFSKSQQIRDIELQSKDFVNKTLNLMKSNKNDYTELSIAWYTGDIQRIADITTKYNYYEDFIKLRDTLEQLYYKQLEVGLDVPYRENYLPTMIKAGELNNVLQLIQDQLGSEIYNDINNKLAEQGLTGETALMFVNNYLRGFVPNAILLSGSNFTKRRTLPVSPEFFPYYEDFLQTYNRYIITTVNNISDRRFFGKSTEENQKLLTQLKRKEQALKELDITPAGKIKKNEIYRLNFEKTATELKLKEYQNIYNGDYRNTTNTINNNNISEDNETLYQAINRNLNLNQEVNILDISKLIKQKPTKENAKQVIWDIAEKGKKMETLSKPWVVDIINKREKKSHILNSSLYGKFGAKEYGRRNIELNSIEDIINNSILVERVDNNKLDKKPNVEEYFYFYTPIKDGKNIYLVKIVAEKLKGENDLKNVHLYDIFDSRLNSEPNTVISPYKLGSENLTDEINPSGTSDTSQNNLPSMDLSNTLTIKDILQNVKDYFGKNALESYIEENDNNKETLYQTSSNQVLDLTEQFKDLKGKDSETIRQEVEKRLNDLIGEIINTASGPLQIQITDNHKGHIINSNVNMTKNQKIKHDSALLNLKDIINNSTVNNTRDGSVDSLHNSKRTQERKKNIEQYRYFDSQIVINDNTYNVILTTEVLKNSDDKNISNLYNVQIKATPTLHKRNFSGLYSDYTTDNFKSQEKNQTFFQTDTITKKDGTVIDLTEQFKDLKGKDSETIRQEVEKRLNDLIGEIIDTASEPLQIQITRENRGHIKNSNLSLNQGQRERHNTAIVNLEQIINNSIYDSEKPVDLSHNKSNITLKHKEKIEKYRYFINNIRIYDTNYNVKLTTEVLKNTNNKNISDLYNIEIKKERPAVLGLFSDVALSEKNYTTDNFKSQEKNQTFFQTDTITKKDGTVIDLRQLINELNDKLNNINEQIKYVESTSPFILLNQRKKETQEEIKLIKEQLKDNENLENSIAKFVMKETNLNIEQQNKLKQYLFSLFNSKPTGKFTQITNTISGMYNLANFKSALKQLSEISSSIKDFGLKNTFASLFSEKKVDLKDFGFESEFELEDTSLLNRLYSKALKYTGFDKMDFVGKNTYVNTALLAIQQRLINNDLEINKQIELIFDEKAETVKENILVGNVDYDVMTYLFSLLNNNQPLTNGSKTKFYNDNPAIRFAYSLKSYVIQQLSLIKNDILNEVMKGNYKKAMQNAIKLQFALWVSGVPISMFAHWIFDDEDEEYLITDAIIDNIILNNIINRFNLSCMAGGRVVNFLTGLASPTFLRPADNLVRDLYDITKGEFENRTIKNMSIVKNIPERLKLND